MDDMDNGRISLDACKLKNLRRNLGFSQQHMSDICYTQQLYISLSSIKRAELGKKVLYRTARELAVFYGVTVTYLTSPQSKANTYNTGLAQAESINV